MVAARASAEAAAASAWRVLGRLLGALVSRHDPIAARSSMMSSWRAMNAVDERLGARRAAGDVHVHRNHLVDALQNAVVARVGAAIGGACAHRDDPLGIRHLLVKQLHCRRHLLRHGAGDDHHVRLARRRPRHDAEAVEVVVRHVRRDHLDRAAREAERHRPQRRLPRRRDDEVGRHLDHARQHRAVQRLAGTMLDRGEPRRLVRVLARNDRGSGGAIGAGAGVVTGATSGVVVVGSVVVSTAIAALPSSTRSRGQRRGQDEDDHRASKPTARGR